jgi:hypothetical protein
MSTDEGCLLPPTQRFPLYLNRNHFEGCGAWGRQSQVSAIYVRSLAYQLTDKAESLGLEHGYFVFW